MIITIPKKKNQCILSSFFFVHDLFLNFSIALGASPIASDPFIMRKRLHDSTNILKSGFGLVTKFRNLLKVKEYVPATNEVTY